MSRNPKFLDDHRFYPIPLPQATFEKCQELAIKGDCVKERVENIIGSIFFVAYGAYGVWSNDLHLAFGRRSPGIHLHDIAAWLMFAASICGCVVLLTVVVDHYDQRNNETNYKKIADVLKKSGIAFAILSILAWALMEIF